MLTCSLTCFGVGDGMPCADRNHSSYLYRLGETTLLFDCGEPLSRSYKASGLSYDLFDRLFISHLHADHIGGFFMFIQSLWLEQRQKDLVVHVPAEGLEPLQRMLRAGYLFDEVLPFRLKFEAWQPSTAVKQGSIRVTPFPTTHLDHFRRAYQAKYPADYAAFSFLLETPQGRIVHSADLGAVTDLDALLTQPLHLLVCELAHFRAEDLFDYLRSRSVERLVLMHLGRPYWDRFEETRKLAAKMLPGMNVLFPRDLDRITF
jgi:ribonuclease Z